MSLRIFNRIDPENIERRELQLSVLVSVTLCILAVGLALLMYPAVFTHQVVVSGQNLRIAFFGFCVLTILLVGYVLDRQLTIRQLRRRIVEELRRNVELRRQASSDLLTTLPDLRYFRDRLAMEYRRMASTQQALSVMAIKLRVSANLSDASEVTAAFGDAAKALSSKLRAEDSIYLFCPGLFTMVFPGVDTNNAYRLVDRLAEGLRDASGASKRFDFDIQVFNYPENAATASELEQRVLAFLPENVPEILGVAGTNIPF